MMLQKARFRIARVRWDAPAPRRAAGSRAGKANAAPATRAADRPTTGRTTASGTGGANAIRQRRTAGPGAGAANAVPPKRAADQPPAGRSTATVERTTAVSGTRVEKPDTLRAVAEPSPAGRAEATATAESGMTAPEHTAAPQARSSTDRPRPAVPESRVDTGARRARGAATRRTSTERGREP
jgi:hypothetical protein